MRLYRSTYSLATCLHCKSYEISNSRFSRILFAATAQSLTGRNSANLQPLALSKTSEAPHSEEQRTGIPIAKASLMTIPKASSFAG